jgi:hypothetical protein
MTVDDGVAAEAVPSRPPRRPSRASLQDRRRDQTIAELALAGEEPVAIGERFGAASSGAAVRLVQRALDRRLPHFDPDLARRVDAARLDQLMSVWWPRATAGETRAAFVVIAIIEARRTLDPAHARELAPSDPDALPGALPRLDREAMANILSLLDMDGDDDIDARLSRPESFE